MKTLVILLASMAVILSGCIEAEHSPSNLAKKDSPKRSESGKDGNGGKLGNRGTIAKEIINKMNPSRLFGGELEISINELHIKDIIEPQNGIEKYLGWTKLFDDRAKLELYLAISLKSTNQSNPELTSTKLLSIEKIGQFVNNTGKHENLKINNISFNLDELNEAALFVQAWAASKDLELFFEVIETDRKLRDELRKLKSRESLSYLDSVIASSSLNISELRINASRRYVAHQMDKEEKPDKWKKHFWLGGTVRLNQIAVNPSKMAGEDVATALYDKLEAKSTPLVKNQLFCRVNNTHENFTLKIGSVAASTSVYEDELIQAYFYANSQIPGDHVDKPNSFLDLMSLNGNETARINTSYPDRACQKLGDNDGIGVSFERFILDHQSELFMGCCIFK